MQNLNVQQRKKTTLLLQKSGRTDFMCTESSKTQVHGTRNPSFIACVCVHKHSYRESVHVCVCVCIKLYI